MMKGKGGRGRRNKAKVALVTLLTLLVAGVACLVTCWFTYEWTWDKVLYWLNPFSEGNNWTWLLYFGVALFVLVLIWLIHQARMEKIMDEDGR